MITAEQDALCPNLVKAWFPELYPAAWPALLARARHTGYANRFAAIRADIVWRPALFDDTGIRLNPRPTVPGSQTAIVVGPDGSTANAGTVHTDSLGRIRIRYHWQTGEANTCWVRVAQLFAGPGYGAQFIPRIGQEVLVTFFDNDIDRPLVNAEAVPQPLKSEELTTFDEARLQDEKEAKTLGRLFSNEKDFKYFNAIYQREQWREEDNPYADVTGQDKIRRLETQEEMEQRISDYIPEPTDHSSLPENQAFMERVAAYDLPIGFCDRTGDAKFWKELRREADWLSGADAYYAKGILDVPPMPADVDRETLEDETDNRYKGG